MKNKMILFFALLVLGTVPALGNLISQKKYDHHITLCHEDISVFPWLKKDSQTALLNLQIQMIQKISNIKITLMPLPWKRCQLRAKIGEINGILSATFTLDRKTWSQYPLDEKGVPKREFRLHTDSFMVYKHKSSPIKWNDKKFENLGSTVVGVQLGYSAQEDLMRMNIPVYTSFSTTAELLRAVSNNFIHAAVLQKYATNLELKNHSKYAKNIVEMDEPFKTVDQYITFNKFFYSKNQDVAEKIWLATKISRESPEYQAEFKKLVD